MPLGTHHGEEPASLCTEMVVNAGDASMIRQVVGEVSVARINHDQLDDVVEGQDDSSCLHPAPCFQTSTQRPNIHLGSFGPDRNDLV